MMQLVAAAATAYFQKCLCHSAQRLYSWAPE